jgi:hypothetical protein
MLAGRNELYIMTVEKFQLSKHRLICLMASRYTVKLKGALKRSLRNMAAVLEGRGFQKETQFV